MNGRKNNTRRVSRASVAEARRFQLRLTGGDRFPAPPLRGVPR
jgi:hypothetical protein